MKLFVALACLASYALVQSTHITTARKAKCKKKFDALVFDDFNDLSPDQKTCRCKWIQMCSKGNMNGDPLECQKKDLTSFFTRNPFDEELMNNCN